MKERETRIIEVLDFDENGNQVLMKKEVPVLTAEEHDENERKIKEALDSLYKENPKMTEKGFNDEEIRTEPTIMEVVDFLIWKEKEDEKQALKEKSKLIKKSSIFGD